MQFVATDTLENIISRIDSFSDEMILFVVKDESWKPSSTSLVYHFDTDEVGPFVIDGAEYFLEVALVKDVMEVWKDWTSAQHPPLAELVEAVIHYAEYDAYKEV
nr:hypothetical protein [uncultured Mucilaginibacter sp.]